MIGAILAGGAGKRMGGVSKAMLELDGRPLAVHVATVLAEVCERVAIVCKPDTEVPDDRRASSAGTSPPSRGTR